MQARSSWKDVWLRRLHSCSLQNLERPLASHFPCIVVRDNPWNSTWKAKRYQFWKRREHALSKNKRVGVYPLGDRYGLQCHFYSFSRSCAPRTERKPAAFAVGAERKPAAFAVGAERKPTAFAVGAELSIAVGAEFAVGPVGALGHGGVLGDRIWCEILAHGDHLVSDALACVNA